MENDSHLDVGNIQNLIGKYEIFVGEITKDIENFQNEYGSLKHKVKLVVSENEKLSKDINFLLNEHYANSESGHYDQQIVTNLKKQLSLIVSEKEYTMQLWQNAVNTIDNLEKELRVYQDGRKQYIPKEDVDRLKFEQDKKIRSLQAELAAAKAKIQMKESEFRASCVAPPPMKVIENLEDVIASTQKRLMTANKIKAELVRTIKKQNKKIQELKVMNRRSQEKVSEAIQVVEAAFMEKDVALNNEKEARAEARRISFELVEVIRNTEKEIKDEVDLVKSELGCNLKTILEDLKTAKGETLLKQKEIDVYASECKRLEKEIDQLRKENFSEAELIGESRSANKMLQLEKNYEQTFQKLLTSERENIILKSEIERMKSDIEEMTRHYETDIKIREIEKTSLTTKIKQVEQQISNSDRKYVDVLAQLEDMKSRYAKIKQDFEEDMTHKKSKTNLEHAMEIGNLKEKYDFTIKQLEDQLGSQVKLNYKWRDETKIIVNELGSQVRHQKDIISKLGHTNYNLQQKLKMKKERLDGRNLKECQEIN